MKYGTLRITTPDGQAREHPLDTPAVRIGRSPENNIVVDHVTVSRRHARVTIDSGQCFIEDVGSDAGTFVGGARLGPGERQILGMAPVRIGDVDIAYSAPATTGPGAGGAPAPPVAAPGQTLTVRLNGPAAPAAPGATATASVEIQNRGSTVDQITVEVVDLPPGWGSVARPSLTLLPGARDEVVVTLSPPKGVGAAAGDHPFGVAVRSSVHGTEVRALGMLSVSQVAGFSLTMQPVRSRRDFKVALENTGNAPALLTLTAQDDEGKLRFDFETMNVDLRPGERRMVALRVKMRGAPRLGQEVTKGFRVEAATQGEGAKQSASGQLVHKPKLEPWRIPAMAVVVLGALAGGGVAYASRCEPWGLPGCGEEAPAAEADQSPTAQGGGNGSPTAVGGGGETPTGETMTPATTVPPATATTPAPPTPTKHEPGTLRFERPEEVLKPNTEYEAIVFTTAGEFVLELNVDEGFWASNNFAFLAMNGFYDRMPFEPRGESVEHGDPEGDGTGNAGYFQEREVTGLKNTRGTVGMVPAPQDPGFISCEWYVNLEDNTTRFDSARIRGNPRPVFAEVTKGLEVVEKLTEKDLVQRIEIREK